MPVIRWSCGGGEERVEAAKWKAATGELELVTWDGNLLSNWRREGTSLFLSHPSEERACFT